jgi:predicted PurR-regulated permease PerM
MENIGARGRLMYAGIGLVFALVLAVYFLYQARVIVLVFLVTLLFSIIVSGPVDYLARRGLRRAWGTLAVLGGFVLVLTLAGLALAPTISSEAQELVETLPTLVADVQELVAQAQNALGLQAVDLRPDPQQILETARNFFSGGTASTVLGVGASVANALSMGLVILIATIYAVAQPTPLLNGFVALFPAARRERVREILSKMYKAVQRWFLGQLVSMSVIGILFTVTLSVIGIPFALLLGILSGLLAFIPFVGPIISIIPPILLALVQENPIAALWVVLAYLVIQFIEGNIVHPLVMSRAVSLHPVVVVFALLIMGTLFGFIGVLLAIPLIAALFVLVRELWVERMDELGTDPNPPKEEEEPPTKAEMGRLRRAAEALFRRS